MMNKLTRQQQTGSTLIVTLVLLFILTIIAVRAVSFNSILTRVASNSGDALVSILTTEGAINQGITDILKGTYSANRFISNTNGLYTFNPNNPAMWTSLNWTSSSAAIQGYQGDSGIKAAYIIEQLPSVTLPGQSMKKPTLVYRITARGVGASGGTPIIIQAIIQVPQ